MHNNNINNNEQTQEAHYVYSESTIYSHAKQLSRRHNNNYGTTCQLRIFSSLIIQY